MQRSFCLGRFLTVYLQLRDLQLIVGSSHYTKGYLIRCLILRHLVCQGSCQVSFAYGELIVPGLADRQASKADTSVFRVHSAQFLKLLRIAASLLHAEGKHVCSQCTPFQFLRGRKIQGCRPRYFICVRYRIRALVIANCVLAGLCSACQHQLAFALPGLLNRIGDLGPIQVIGRQILEDHLDLVILVFIRICCFLFTNLCFSGIQLNRYILRRHIRCGIPQIPDLCGCQVTILIIQLTGIGHGHCCIAVYRHCPASICFCGIIAPAGRPAVSGFLAYGHCGSVRYRHRMSRLSVADFLFFRIILRRDLAAFRSGIAVVNRKRQVLVNGGSIQIHFFVNRQRCVFQLVPERQHAVCLVGAHHACLDGLSHFQLHDLFIHRVCAGSVNAGLLQVVGPIGQAADRKGSVFASNICLLCPVFCVRLAAARIRIQTEGCFRRISCLAVAGRAVRCPVGLLPQLGYCYAVIGNAPLPLCR